MVEYKVTDDQLRSLEDAACTCDAMAGFACSVHAMFRAIRGQILVPKSRAIEQEMKSYLMEGGKPVC